MSRRKQTPAVRPSRPAGTPQPSPSRLRPIAIAIALAVVTAVIYAPVRTFEFVNWDDPSYITENVNVQNGLTWKSVTWALTTAYSPYWHPLTWLTHLADVELYGLDAGGHHVTNLVLHVLNTVLLFALLRRMTGAEGRSAFVAAVFGLHPLHVESVAWVTERKDVLSGLFWILTIWAYAAYVDRPTLRRYAVVLGVYLLALMSKPMVVTLPIVLLLLDYWPFRRFEQAASGERPAVSAQRRAVLDKVPLLALSVATGITTIVIQRRVGAVAGLDVLSVPERIANAIVAYAEYLWKTVWPAHLAAFYPFHTYPVALVAAVALGLLAVTVIVLMVRATQPHLLVGWLWYVVTIAPVVGLLQAGEQRIADRFMYLPMIGLLIMAAWGVPALLERWRLRPSAGWAAAAIVVASAATARAQVERWSDSITLWQHATRATPDSYIAFENLGQALRERGSFDESMASYVQALELAPPKSPGYLAVIHNSMGMVLTRQGRTGEALIHFAEAARFSPRFVEAQTNFANALASEGRLPEAIEHYRAAIAIKPELAEAQVGLGGALLSLRRPSEAIPHYTEALRLDPNLAEAHNGLGAALAMEGKDAEAMTRYAEALRLKPNLPTAHLNVAVVLIKQGKIDEARRQLETALSIDPGYAPARQLLERLTVR